MFAPLSTRIRDGITRGTKSPAAGSCARSSRADVRYPALRYAIIDSIHQRSIGGTVANLIVRGIDEALVRALKQRAAKHGRSAEAEHREILASVLRGPRKRRLAEVLTAIPAVGKDDDFVRIEDATEAPRV